ncbi:MAG: sigma-70 family RNA polymerase sigma factor [Myxococcales bacterium]|nr:sigma-70 family RNA polymerase sigma factor [Myxococcales bacterium]
MTSNDARRTRSPADRERDDALVARVRRGDDAAFRELFDLYHRRAFAVAMGVVKNPQDARDVVQDAFVKVHTHMDRFQGSSSFYTWLYRIVMNLAIDHVRRTSKRRNLEFDDAIARPADEVAGDGALLPTILDGDPAKTAARKELLQAIEGALDTLPEHHRAVILLREIDGMSYEEIAETLEIPKGTVMSRLFHARKKMQAALAPYVDGSTPAALGQASDGGARKEHS